MDTETPENFDKIQLKEDYTSPKEPEKQCKMECSFDNNARIIISLPYLYSIICCIIFATLLLKNRTNITLKEKLKLDIDVWIIALYISAPSNLYKMIINSSPCFPLFEFSKIPLILKIIYILFFIYDIGYTILSMGYIFGYSEVSNDLDNIISSKFQIFLFIHLGLNTLYVPCQPLYMGDCKFKINHY